MSCPYRTQTRPSLLSRAATPFITELEALLHGSFPNPGDADKVRQMFLDALETDGLGVGARLLDGKVHFTYPIVILCSDGVGPA